jgi:GTPase SAR1 family protein
LDCIIFVFSWSDVQSFLEIIEYIKELEKKGKKFAKLVLGTKFDQIVHSEITQEMIDDFENEFHTKIIRFSSMNAKFEHTSSIINKLTEILLTRDKELAHSTNKTTTGESVDYV